VTSVPDAPIAVGDSFTLLQDTMTSLAVMGNDSDGDFSPLTLSGVSLPLHGTIVINGSNFDYTPNSGYAGTDSFTYRLEDDTGLLSNIVTVNLTITSTNSAPTTYDLFYTMNEDSILNATLSGTDLQNDTLTYSLVSGVSQGTLSLSATGSFRYIPLPNTNGSVSFAYRASDASLTSTASTVVINISAVNDAPTAQ
jgi:large repetitive protein